MWKRDYSRFETAILSFELKPHQYLILTARYLPLLRHLHYRANRIATFFHTSRTIITVGSLLVPALLSIQNTEGLSTNTAREIYWATWVISLLVTMCNGLITLFKLDKRYYFLYTTLEHMVSEGWQFLELTGKYSGFYTPGQPATHENQFIFFCATIEKIRMKQVEEEYFKLTEKEQSPPNTQPTQSASTSQGAATSSLQHLTPGSVPTPFQNELMARVPPEVLVALQQLSQPPVENAGSRQNQAAGAAPAAAAAPSPTENTTTQNPPNRQTPSVSMRIMV
jgi:hypothetical protein